MRATHVIGQRIEHVRDMTREEADREGWDLPGGCVVLVLTNGVKLYASQDGEGNGPGVLLGNSGSGVSFEV